MRVFADSGSISQPDRIVDGELRWQTIGIFDGMTVLTVAHTVYEEGEAEVIRIISARRSNRLSVAAMGKFVRKTLRTRSRQLVRLNGSPGLPRVQTARSITPTFLRWMKNSGATPSPTPSTVR